MEMRETLLDSLVTSAPIGIAVIDRRWRISRINELAAAALGKPAAELVGQDLWASATALQGTPYEAPCREAMTSGAPARFEAADGDDVRWEVRITPAEDGLVLWWLDASARAGVAAKTLRLRALAHDLRTPLTVIGLNAELLAAMAARRGDTGEQQKAEAVSRAAQQLHDVAQTLSATLREGTT
jgi:nitrogen fixation/metabolism regulation signal transduction histidine kinase